MKGALNLYIKFAKIGLFTIGGGLAMIPLITEEVCEKNKWLSREEMVDAVAVCQSLPGVIAVNMAGYVGYKLDSFRGALLSTLGVITPSFVIIILLSYIFSNIEVNFTLEFVMKALRAASAALIFSTAVSIWKQTAKDAFTVLLAILSFVMVFFLKFEVYIVVLVSAAFGIIFRYKRADK